MSLDLFIPFLIATAILLATTGLTILLVVSYALRRVPAWRRRGRCVAR